MNAETNVGQIMTELPVTVNDTAKLAEALRTLLWHNVSTLPVVDEDETIQGIINEQDVMEHVCSTYIDGSSVKEAMITDPCTVAPSSSVHDALQLFKEHSYRMIPVISEGKLCGVLSRQDVLREKLADYNSGVVAVND